jgi:hypothetical protein
MAFSMGALFLKHSKTHVEKMASKIIEHNLMNGVPHPTYALDITPSDISLFEYINQIRISGEFPNRKPFLMRIDGILEDIEKVTFERVFDN